MENSTDYAITHAHAWLSLRTLWFQDLRISSLTIPFVSAFFHRLPARLCCVPLLLCPCDPVTEKVSVFPIPWVKHVIFLSCSRLVVSQKNFFFSRDRVLCSPSWP